MNKVNSHDGRRSRPASMNGLGWQRVKLDLYVRSQTITDRIQAVLLGRSTTATTTKVDTLTLNKKQQRRWSWSPWHAPGPTAAETMAEILPDGGATQSTAAISPSRTIYERRRNAQRPLYVPHRRSSLPGKEDGEDELLKCLSLAHIYLDVVLPHDELEKRYYEEESDDEGSASDDEYETSSDEDVADNRPLQAFSPAPAAPTLYEIPACASSFILPMYGPSRKDEEAAVYRKGETDVHIDRATIQKWVAEDRCRSCWSDDSDCE